MIDLPDMVKLSKRLQALFNTISAADNNEAYDEIWDCCCDHGYLGMELLNEHIGNKVHFVDQVAHITFNLKKHLHNFPPETYTVITDSAVNIQPSPARKHLVILAGIGGKTTIKLLEAIHTAAKKSLPNNQSIDISYLVSPNHHLYNVREFLLQQGLYLVDESLIYENKKLYEIILVSSREPVVKNNPTYKPLTPVGTMWELDNQQHQDHLKILIAYYQTKFDNTGDNNALQALIQYKNLVFV